MPPTPHRGFAQDDNLKSLRCQVEERGLGEQGRPISGAAGRFCHSLDDSLQPSPFTRTEPGRVLGTGAGGGRRTPIQAAAGQAGEVRLFRGNWDTCHWSLPKRGLTWDGWEESALAKKRGPDLPHPRPRSASEWWPRATCGY